MQADLWTKDRFAMARTWLATCCDSHEDCRNKKAYRPPTRLISIEHDAVSLVITENLQSPPQYATLSYCWGQQPFTKLTRENIRSFMDRIPRDELPPTFTDAFEVARQLEIHYIWIDALCIVQNDDPNAPNNDWAKEAGHMSSVYGGAHLNLAATTATSPHQGFLQRPEKPVLGFVAEITSGGCRTARSFCKKKAFKEGTTKTLLAGRAWAFQERMLPARTMYFDDRGLFWRCRSGCYADFAPDGEVRCELEYTGDISGGRLEDQPWDWETVTEEYSLGQLTVSSDKLPALSGIAARQAEITRDQYLAGMWRESLRSDLGWWVQDPIQSRPEWRAPTWSWASVEGKISIRRYQVRVNGMWFIQVEDAWTTLVDPSLPYGAVSKGELTLSCCHLFRGHLLYAPAGRVVWTRTLKRQASEADKKSDDDDSDYNERCVLLKQELNIGPVPITLDFDCLEKTPDPGKDIVYILPVVCSELLGCGSIRGLVLQLCADTKGCFRRVGSFDIVGVCGPGPYAAVYKVLKEAYISKVNARDATSSLIEGSEHAQKRPYKIVIE